MKSFIDRSANASDRSHSNSVLNETDVSALTNVMVDIRAAAVAQRRLIASIGNSSSSAQLAADEEMLQGKFDATQRVEDEEMLQGKFDATQRVEDEELMQGKFEPIQRVEEDELVQGKFETLQKKENKTGLPDDLKSGMEGLSGHSLDHVKVHYNSPKPASVQAHAYAQGSDIHLASGQETHLPHELGHVVQQMEGRVKPTTNVAGVAVNDNPGLENEATAMGARALQRAVQAGVMPAKQAPGKSPRQLVTQLRMDAGDGAEWHIHHDHMKLGNLVKSRVEFNGRSAKDIRKELGEKIERHGLSVGGDQATSFRECINYINDNY